MDDRAIAAKILEVPDDPQSWELTPYPESGLAIVNYTQSANMDIYGKLKGTVIDINTQRIICQSYEHTSTAISNLDKEVWIPDDNGYLKLTDSDGINFFFHKDNIKIRPLFPGMVIRVFKHNGIVYYSSHRKLELTDSKIPGSSISFLDMYKNLGGPDGHNLFPSGDSNSPFCYMFLMVHRDLVNVSKINLRSDGFIVYLGVKSTDITLDEPVVLDTSTDINSGKLVSPTDMSVEEANLFLNWGYSKPSNDVINFVSELTPGEIDQFYKNISLTISEETLGYMSEKVKNIKDPRTFLTEVKRWILMSNEISNSGDIRLYPGESVIIYRKTLEGAWEAALKIYSVSYNWRHQMIKNSVNIYRRFFELADQAKYGIRDKGNAIDFIADYPYMGDFDPTEIKDQLEIYGHIIGWPVLANTSGDITQYLSKYSHRLKNIHAAFFMSVALRLQPEVWGMLRRYQTDKRRLANWLFELYRKWNGKQPELISEPSLKLKELGICLEARNIISKSAKSAKSNVKNNIRNGIRAVNGRTMYRMVVNMNKFGL